jgi:hypothetical protein
MPDALFIYPINLLNLINESTNMRPEARRPEPDAWCPMPGARCLKIDLSVSAMSWQTCFQPLIIALLLYKNKKPHILERNGGLDWQCPITFG